MRSWSVNGDAVRSVNMKVISTSFAALFAAGLFTFLVGERIPTDAAPHDPKRLVVILAIVAGGIAALCAVAASLKLEQSVTSFLTRFSVMSMTLLIYYYGLIWGLVGQAPTEMPRHDGYLFASFASVLSVYAVAATAVVLIGVATFRDLSNQSRALRITIGTATVLSFLFLVLAALGHAP